MSAELAVSIATLLVALTAMASAITLLRRRAGANVISVPDAAAGPVRQHTLMIGFIESCALVALAAAFLDAPAGSRLTWLTGAAFICVAAMGGVWLTWLVPLNAALASGTKAARPSDESHHETRWAVLHALRLILAILALALLVMGMVARPLQ